MAISRDEGASWRLVHVTDSDVEDLYTTSVAADGSGDIYLGWIAGSRSPNANPDGILGSGRPYLSVSRNHGSSWSKPLAVGPPGVADAQMIAVAAESRQGRVAISYLANTNHGRMLEGWLSETHDALARHPLWWAAALDRAAAPLIDAAAPTTFGNRLFANTDTFAPDGEPWAAFHCAFTAACPGARIGVVGRLRTPLPLPRPRSLVTLSPARGCVNAHGVRLTLRSTPTARVARLTLRIDQGPARVVHGAGLRRGIRLAPPSRGFTLRLTAWLLGGGNVSLVRAYRRCS
jgi:hypothetical protein